VASLVAKQSLDEWTVVDCYSPDDGPLFLDLRQCEFIRPAGLVGAAVAIRRAMAFGQPVEIRLPGPTDAIRYAERMGLGDLAFGASGDTFPVVQRHPSEDKFVELTTFDGKGEHFAVIDDVCRTLLSRVDTWDVDKRILHNAVFELGQNVEQHADSPGLACAQHFPNRGCVEFAVGDFGVGIPGSLRAAGFDMANDVAGIRTAVETDASRMSDEPWRGAGLPGLLHFVCGSKMRGHLVVHFGRGRVVYRHDQTRGLHIQERASADDIPGTFVFGMLRTTGGKS
jgi:hypothetical protein